MVIAGALAREECGTPEVAVSIEIDGPCGRNIVRVEIPVVIREVQEDASERPAV